MRPLYQRLGRLFPWLCQQQLLFLYRADLRPALILSPSLLTSIDDEAEQPAGKTEAETYAEYCAYVMDWAGYAEEGGQDQGTSPLTYEEWKEENEG